MTKTWLNVIPGDNSMALWGITPVSISGRISRSKQRIKIDSDWLKSCRVRGAVI